MIQTVKRGDSHVIVMTGSETAKTPFVLFGCDNDVWLFDPIHDSVACLMLHGETFSFEFMEENNQQIKIEWNCSLTKITELFLIIFNHDTQQTKGFSYPTNVLESLANVLAKAKNLKS
ncbi:hypothetical protein [Wielerella bovis]|uniref:hypothetical protein n=1 Tax=Wielerella bovis TaxID=2917790 RepID=UPI0020188A43|nr:hypothetical protein [Wielerella bovis]MCG7656074.1 hypothetical protein [Wielerella bovis]MCG7658300.1 hypothetical protein [Wielerella bovis]